MVRVQIRPSHPGTFRQPPEYGVRPCLAAGRTCGALHERSDPSDVVLELSGPGSAQPLIDFRAGWDAGRPMKRRVQSDPLDQCPLQRPGSVARPAFANHHQKRIAQMADHLMRGHHAPSSCRVFAQVFQPCQQLGPVVFTRERFHRASSRSPPASRNAASARARPSSAWASSD